MTLWNWITLGASRTSSNASKEISRLDWRKRWVHHSFDRWEAEGTNGLPKPSSPAKKATYRWNVDQETTRKMHTVVTATQMQQLAGQNISGNFIVATKAVYGPTYHGQTPIRSKASLLLKDKGAVDRCKDFNKLLIRERTFDQAVLNDRQRPIIKRLAEPPNSSGFHRYWTT